MSPPLSRLEREDPPPRRKSCLACVKSKRRCDQAFPACLRCAQRRISCNYPSWTGRSTRAQTQPALNARSAPRQTRDSDEVHRENITASDVSIGASPDMRLLESFQADDETYNYEDSQLHEDSFVNAEGPASTTLLMDVSCWTAQLDDMPFHGDVVADSEVYCDMSLARMPSAYADVSIGLPSQLVSPSGFNVEAVTRTLECKLSYTVEQIKAAPSQMLLEMQTPWCHNSLYKDEIPRYMQEALSACALYASKNAVNGPVIMRCINAKVDDLLGFEMPTEFLHALARTQALLLYQIIRFFDGDIIARSAANATFSELQSSAHALAGHIIWSINNHSDSGRSGLDGEDCNTSLGPVLQPSRHFWREWVLQESARRTFLIACFFIHVWKLLSGLQPTPCGDMPPLMSQAWTLSSHLWQARDAFDFAAAWRDKKHYVVKRRAILSTLADANGDDIEVFGKMLLTVALGIEEAKAYLSLKGSFL